MRRAFVAAVAAALVTAGAASAEMPRNRSAPELTGRAAVGWGLVGHNGTWLYDNGMSCGAECTYAFAWERCSASACAAISSALGRVYKVRAYDVGYRFRVIVSATKYDCGAGSLADGTSECRWVTRSAASPHSEVVPEPPKKPKAKKPKAKKPRKAKGPRRP